MLTVVLGQKRRMSVEGVHRPHAWILSSPPKGGGGETPSPGAGTVDRGLTWPQALSQPAQPVLPSPYLTVRCR